MTSSLKIFPIYFDSLLYKTNIFQVAMRLFSNRSQRTSKCGKNISDTLGCTSCATFLFLPHFDVICDLLLNRHMATWNLFVNWMTAKQESDLLITSMITDRIGQHKVLLSMTKFEKETRHRLYVFIKISTFNLVKWETTVRS